MSEENCYYVSSHGLIKSCKFAITSFSNPNIHFEIARLKKGELLYLEANLVEKFHETYWQYIKEPIVLVSGNQDINFTDISNLINYPDPYSYQGATTSVKYMSNQQKDQYESQLTLFRQVYAFNYAAYVYAATNNKIPVYYRFKCSSELQTYNASLGLVNKLYNVSELFPYTCLFYMPFPPFCA
jgi:hypothetical protein